MRTTHLFVLALCLSPHAIAQTGQLTIDVSVVGPIGEPVPDVEIGAQYADDGREDVYDVALVDANGQTQLSMPISQTATTVIVDVSPGRDPNASIGERIRRKQRYWNDIRPQYHFEPYYKFIVEPGQESLVVQLQFGPSVTVMGRLVDGSGAPIALPAVMARGVPLFARKYENGSFELSAVAREETCELFILEDDGGMSLSLTADQTQQDVVLGDVVLDLPPANATASIGVDFIDWSGAAIGTFQNVVHGVTAINADGSFFVPFLSDANGNAIPQHQSQSTVVSIPSGTYYLVAGVFSPRRDIHYKAFKLVQSGQAAQVEGWPTLTVEAEQHADVSFNAAATDALIEAAPDPH